LARTLFGYLDFGRNPSAQKGAFASRHGAEAASDAKGDLRQGDFGSPCETRVIMVGGALAQPKTMSTGGIDAADSSANDG
jgi:hypothetical protein